MIENANLVINIKITSESIEVSLLINFFRFWFNKSLIISAVVWTLGFVLGSKSDSEFLN